MDSLQEISKYARELPPREDAAEADLTAATAIDAAATGVGAGGGFHTIACNKAFNVVYGGESVAAPADTGVFEAGQHRFWCEPTDTHFRVTAAENGKLKSWKSSR